MAIFEAYIHETEREYDGNPLDNSIDQFTVTVEADSKGEAENRLRKEHGGHFYIQELYELDEYELDSVYGKEANI